MSHLFLIAVKITWRLKKKLFTHFFVVRKKIRWVYTTFWNFHPNFKQVFVTVRTIGTISSCLWYEGIRAMRTTIFKKISIIFGQLCCVRRPDQRRRFGYPWILKERIKREKQKEEKTQIGSVWRHQIWIDRVIATYTHSHTSSSFLFSVFIPSYVNLSAKKSLTACKSHSKSSNSKTIDSPINLSQEESSWSTSSLCLGFDVYHKLFSRKKNRRRVLLTRTVIHRTKSLIVCLSKVYLIFGQ